MPPITRSVAKLRNIDVDQSAKETSTSFLDLPPEIRNQIYALLIKSSRVSIRWFGGPGFRLEREYEVWAYEPSLSLLRSASQVLQCNKRLQAECAPVFYGAYTFSFLRPYEAMDWTRSIGSSVMHIREIGVNGIELSRRRGSRSTSVADMQSWLELISEARCLRRLELPKTWTLGGFEGQPQRDAKLLSRLVLPLCRKMMERRRAQGKRPDTVPLSFLKLPEHTPEEREEIEARMGSTLTSMLWTPQFKDRLENSYLWDIRCLFNPPDDSDEQRGIIVGF